MRLPVRITVLTLFSVLMIAIVGAVSLINYRQGASTALDTARDMISTSQVSTIENTYKLLRVTSTVINTVAALPASGLTDGSPLLFANYLRDAIRDIPEIYSAFVGFPDGRFIQAISLELQDGTLRELPGMPTGTAMVVRTMAPLGDEGSRRQVWRYFDRTGAVIASNAPLSETSYDPRKRSWFLRAQETGMLGASEVYIFQSLREPGMTISAPMRHVPGAVMGVDIPLDSLAKFVARQKPGQNGAIAIVASDGRLIAHPDPSAMVTSSRGGPGGLHVTNIVELTDPKIRVAADMIGGTSGSERILSVEDDNYVVSVQPVQAFAMATWYVVGVARTDDFTGPLRKGLNRSATTAVALLLLALMLVLIVSNWISTPLITASRFADKISHLDLDAAIPKSSPFVEIQTLRASLIAMRDAIGMFLRYAPKDLVHILVQSGRSAEIGGTRHDIAVLFTDIENFTTMTEHEEPEDVLAHTSLYFETMTESLTSHHAVIDKFIGDAIMALWNTPIEDPSFIDNACLGTLAAFHASKNLNAELAANNFPAFKTRFGLHAGEALVGNVGSNQRMQFTALGPVVNLASRIEGLNKFYGTNVLVSGSIRWRASDTFVFRKIDVVEAKGVTSAVELYELMGHADPQSPYYVEPERIGLRDAFEVALEAYINGRFDHALALLDDLLMADPTNGTALVIAERCNRYASSPPANWSGVFRFETK